MKVDKRRYPRLLCPEEFSGSTLQLESDSYVLISVNFNRTGIALYSHLRLPEKIQCKISFSLKNSDHHYNLESVPAEIRYRHEYETGNQYGIQFLLEECDEQQLEQLESLESYLEEIDNPENRWPLA